MISDPIGLIYSKPRNSSMEAEPIVKILACSSAVQLHYDICLVTMYSVVDRFM
jgi:hypothetical protein